MKRGNKVLPEILPIIHLELGEEEILIHHKVKDSRLKNKLTFKVDKYEDPFCYEFLEAMCVKNKTHPQLTKFDKVSNLILIYHSDISVLELSNKKWRGKVYLYKHI